MNGNFGLIYFWSKSSPKGRKRHVVIFLGFPVQNSPSPSSPLPAYNICLKKTFLLLRKVNHLAPPLNVVKFFGFPAQNSFSPSLPLPACLKKTCFLLLTKVNCLKLRDMKLYTFSSKLQFLYIII